MTPTRRRFAHERCGHCSGHCFTERVSSRFKLFESRANAKSLRVSAPAYPSILPKPTAPPAIPQAANLGLSQTRHRGLVVSRDSHPSNKLGYPQTGAPPLGHYPEPFDSRRPGITRPSGWAAVLPPFRSPPPSSHSFFGNIDTAKGEPAAVKVLMLPGGDHGDICSIIPGRVVRSLGLTPVPCPPPHQDRGWFKTTCGFVDAKLFVKLNIRDGWTDFKVMDYPVLVAEREDIHPDFLALYDHYSILLARSSVDGYLREEIGVPLERHAPMLASVVSSSPLPSVAASVLGSEYNAGGFPYPRSGSATRCSNAASRRRRKVDRPAFSAAASAISSFLQPVSTEPSVFSDGTGVPSSVSSAPPSGEIEAPFTVPSQYTKPIPLSAGLPATHFPVIPSFASQPASHGFSPQDGAAAASSHGGSRPTPHPHRSSPLSFGDDNVPNASVMPLPVGVRNTVAPPMRAPNPNPSYAAPPTPIDIPQRPKPTFSPPSSHQPSTGSQAFFTYQSSPFLVTDFLPSGPERFDTLLLQDRSAHFAHSQTIGTSWDPLGSDATTLHDIVLDDVDAGVHLNLSLNDSSATFQLPTPPPCPRPPELNLYDTLDS